MINYRKVMLSLALCFAAAFGICLFVLMMNLSSSRVEDPGASNSTAVESTIAVAEKEDGQEDSDDWGETDEEEEYDYASYVDGEVTPESLKEAGYPKSLIKLYKKNKEARQFVLDYATYDAMGMRPDMIDISKEVKKGEIPYFCQWDERWGYEYYGDDYLAVTGCGPTSLTMVYCGLTGKTDKNPLTMAKLAEKGGYAVGDKGSLWSMMPELGEKLGLKVQELPTDEETIMQELKAGHPIIAIMGKGTFTDGGHFIVLRGINKYGNIKISDPNSRERTEKGWRAKTLLKEMQTMWSYSL